MEYENRKQGPVLKIDYMKNSDGTGYIRIKYQEAEINLDISMASELAVGILSLISRYKY